VKLSEARAICEHFTPVKRGDKICCSFLNKEDEMCSRPELFQCLVEDAKSPSLASDQAQSPPEPVNHPTPERLATVEVPSTGGDLSTKIALESLPEAIPGDTLATAGDPPERAIPIGGKSGPKVINTYCEDTTWSVSRCNTVLDCPRRFWLRYIAKAPETDQLDFLVLGSAFHEMREAIDTNRKPLASKETVNIVQMASMFNAKEEAWSLLYHLKPETARKLETIKIEAVAKLLAVIDCYREIRPFQIDKSEVELRFEYDGLKFLGYADGESNDGKEIYEFKYAQESGGYNIHTIGRQLTTYLYAKPDANKAIVIVATKPRHKRGKEESIADFYARVRGAQNRQTFETKTYYRSDFNFPNELNELVSIARMGSFSVERFRFNALIPPSNRGTMKCIPAMCSYATYCLVSGRCTYTDCQVDGCKAKETCKAVKSTVEYASQAVRNASADVVEDEGEQE